MAAPSVMRRVLVHASKASTSSPTGVHFTQSLVDILRDRQDADSQSPDDAKACAKMNGDHLLLLSPTCIGPGDTLINLRRSLIHVPETWKQYDITIHRSGKIVRLTDLVFTGDFNVSSEYQGYHPDDLFRPPFCPIHHLSASQLQELPEDILNRGVDCGSVTLVESGDGKVLLIRRSKSLRTFPGIWVPPGGHVEQGETLIEAGLRELEEETGLVVTNDMCHEGHIPILAMWESAYPPLLGMGLPKRHHLVVYLYINLTPSHTASHMSSLLKPDPREVMTCAWMDQTLARRIVAASEMDDIVTDSDSEDYPKTISGLQIQDDGTVVPSELSTAPLLCRASGHGDDKERVSTGTKYALEQWLLLKCKSGSKV